VPERAWLLDVLRFVPAPRERIGAAPGSLAKVGTPLEADLLARLFRHPPLERLLARGPQGNARLWYKRRWSYFLFFVDRVPELYDADGELRLPSELKALDVGPQVEPHALLAVLASSLFHWYFTVFSDNRNVNRREVAAFPVPDLGAGVAAELAALARELMDATWSASALRECTYGGTHTITNRYFSQGATKPVVDRIDEVLAGAYGLSRAQLEHLWWHAEQARGGHQPAAGEVSDRQGLTWFRDSTASRSDRPAPAAGRASSATD
jgi:hypothetical protein